MNKAKNTIELLARGLKRAFATVAKDDTAKEKFFDHILSNETRMVRKYLEQYPDAANWTNNGQTALEASLHSFNNETTALLIEHGAQVCENGKPGENILHSRAFSWAPPTTKNIVLQKYLSLGLDINDKNGQGETILHLAAGDLDFLPQLLLLNPKLDEVDNFGETALSNAVMLQDESIDLLIAAGADLNKGSTPPVVQAIRRGKDYIARKLIESGAKIDGDIGTKCLITLFARAPVTVIDIAGKGSLLAFLINKGANLNGTDEDGFTPLMHAAQKNDKAAVKTLLDHGANFMTMTPDGKTATDYATDKDIRQTLQIKIDDEKAKIKSAEKARLDQLTKTAGKVRLIPKIKRP